MNTRRKLKRRIHKTRRQYHQKAGEESQFSGLGDQPNVEKEKEALEEREQEAIEEREQEAIEEREQEALEEREQEALEDFEEEPDNPQVSIIYQEEIPNIHMASEWKINLNTKGSRIPPIVYLELHGIGKKPLKKYMVDHILDTMPHDERLNLAKQIKNPSFVATKPLEKHIVEYFDFLTIRDADRTCLVLGKTCYDLNNNWRIMILKERDEMYRNRFFVDIDELSDIFGYIEDGIFKINNNGRICSENSTKTEMISEMNEILKLSGSNYWYDTATTREKPQRNSDNLSHEAFCAVTELYLRKLNSERVNKKIWFLNPEQRELMS
jgi:flagellar biosynthesis GTPase FlhF